MTGVRGILALACLLAALAPLALGGWALASGQWAAAVLLFGGWTTYMLGFVVLLEIVESVVRRVVRARGEDAPARAIWSFVRLAVAVPVTMVLYPVAAVACCFAREIAWRGIRYRIRRDGRVEMVEYKPFADSPRPEGANISI